MWPYPVIPVNKLLNAIKIIPVSVIGIKPLLHFTIALGMIVLTQCLLYFSLMGAMCRYFLYASSNSLIELSAVALSNSPAAGIILEASSRRAQTHLPYFSLKNQSICTALRLCDLSYLPSFAKVLSYYCCTPSDLLLC